MRRNVLLHVSLAALLGVALVAAAPVAAQAPAAADAVATKGRS